MNDPFKASKRQWKRFDPEPEDDGSLHEWEIVAWLITFVIAVVLVAVVLGNITAPQNQVPPPHHPAKAQQR